MLLDESDSDLEVIVVEKIKVAKRVVDTPVEEKDQKVEERVRNKAKEVVEVVKSGIVEIEMEEIASEEVRNAEDKDEEKNESDGEWGHDEIVGSDVEMELHGDDDETYGDDFDLPAPIDIATIVANQGQSDADAELARQIEEDEREQEMIIQGSSKDLVEHSAQGAKIGPSCPVCSTSLPIDKNEVSTSLTFDALRC